MSSDERLVRRATQGDPRAFEAIYQRYHQELYRFCLAMVGNPQDAQDALQNTMVKVLRALPGEEREIKLKPWLYRIARNESIETLRKRRDSAELKPDHATAAGVTETAETRERLRTLLADLEQLPERQRAALVMRELSGLEFDQIAASFETTAAVARQTLYEARLSLRQLEAGREMRCAEVMKEISNADGRVTRRREIRAHLRGCADCRAFREEIGKRREDLAAIGPLPLAASAGLLQAMLSGSAGGIGSAAGNSGLAGAVGASAGKAVATSAVLKSAATVAVVAVVGVSAADRGGLIDLPAPGGGGSPQTQNGPGADAWTGARGAVDGNGTGPDGKGSRKSAAAPGDDQRGGRQEGENGRGKHDESLPGRPSQITGANSPSQAEMGANPPGGGHGRSASERRGRPEQLPDAADHGQQTAAGNKPPQATAPPGKSAARQKPSGDPPASPPSQPQPVAPDGAPDAAPPADEAPPKAASGGAAPEPGAAPPGLERQN